MLSSVLVPIDRAGWPFIAIAAVVAVALAWLNPSLGWVGAIVTVWCVYFFRDPPRVTPTRSGLLISPADGVVQRVDRARPPPELQMDTGLRDRIAIFMNVFDVHVNRSPCEGTVERRTYRPGRFFNASLDKASEQNERLCLRLAMEDGRDLACVQIAGLVARRIVCRIQEGQRLRVGERLGMIRFGSRVDVYLPEGVAPLVAEGQRCVAGETVIADLRAQEPARTGEVR